MAGTRGGRLGLLALLVLGLVCLDGARALDISTYAPALEQGAKKPDLVGPVAEAVRDTKSAFKERFAPRPELPEDSAVSPYLRKIQTIKGDCAFYGRLPVIRNVAAGAVSYALLKEADKLEKDFAFVPNIGGFTRYVKGYITAKHDGGELMDDIIDTLCVLENLLMRVQDIERSFLDRRAEASRYAALFPETWSRAKFALYMQAHGQCQALRPGTRSDLIRRSRNAHLFLEMAEARKRRERLLRKIKEQSGGQDTGGSSDDVDTAGNGAGLKDIDEWNAFNAEDDTEHQPTAHLKGGVLDISDFHRDMLGLPGGRLSTGDNYDSLARMSGVETSRERQAEERRAFDQGKPVTGDDDFSAADGATVDLGGRSLDSLDSDRYPSDNYSNSVLFGMGLPSRKTWREKAGSA